MPSEYSARETLELMLGHLGFVFEVEEERREGGSALNIKTRDPGRLIGRNGKTLEDLQYLLNRILASHEDDVRTHAVVDVEHYRRHQNSDFMNRVHAAIERVKRTGQEIELPPMNSFDRRLVHNACQSDGEIESVSASGEARLKPIVLRPKKKS
jgi:spoIIIJ-associated protein